MATGKENEAAATIEKPVTEETAAKPVKEKKNRAPRAKKPKTASHPPYFEMIKEALMALKEKNGSSPYAIAKHMEEKHKAVLPANFRKMLGLQLKNSTARGKLMKIKASYKLSESGTGKKKDQMEKTKRKPRSISRRKTRSVNKKTEVKPKKTASAKPKQPKSIKSTAGVAKRTRKSGAVIASAS
ncbi:Histone H1 [Euphorbia peplus]|nr:Histone H1 [Euphorbia peplus]